MRLRAEAGFTLVEILAAMTLMSVGVGATLRVFGSSGRTAQAAQRDQVATQKAQAAIDQLGTTPYNQLGLTSAPASSTDPLNPGYRVSGITLAVRPGLTESFVLPSDPGQAGAAVNPAAEPFTVGSGESAISGNVYRYITWRDETCPDRCLRRNAEHQAADRRGHRPRERRGADGRAGLGVEGRSRTPRPCRREPPGPPGPPAPRSAPRTSTCTTRAAATARGSPSTAGHATHNTAQTSAAAGSTSFCENPASDLQPDLMGVEAPDDATSTPLYQLSDDLTGAYDGLAMKGRGTSCPTTYDAADATNLDATNQWSLHAWATNSFASPFTLAGQVTMSLFTSTVGGVPGAGVICATLLTAPSWADGRLTSASAPSPTRSTRGRRPSGASASRSTWAHRRASRQVTGSYWSLV